MRKKAIRISDSEHEMIEKARNELAKSGLDVLDKEECPNCGTEMHGIKLNFHYSSCPNCGSEVKGFWLSVKGAFTLGALAGLGIAALLYYLHKKQKG